MKQRVDATKIFVIKTIFLNNRLNSYKQYIREALEKNYKVCSMVEFYREKDVVEEKHFILRHDVDHVTVATRKMFDVEKQCGVTSTYYFRKSTMDEALIKDMLDSGFEVGFHYETISDYARENKLNEISTEDIEKCKELLKQEIRDFEAIIGTKIYSIASHGAPGNRKLGISNNILLENEMYVDYGIWFEAYDKEMYDKFINEHIMDCNIRYNYGYAYKSNPIEAMAKNAANIVFLAHPNHWYFERKEQFKNVFAILLGKCTFATNRVFERIKGETKSKELYAEKE